MSRRGRPGVGEGGECVGNRRLSTDTVVLPQSVGDDLIERHGAPLGHRRDGGFFAQGSADRGQCALPAGRIVGWPGAADRYTAGRAAPRPREAAGPSARRQRKNWALAASTWAAGPCPVDRKLAASQIITPLSCNTKFAPLALDSDKAFSVSNNAIGAAPHGSAVAASP